MTSQEIEIEIRNISNQLNLLQADMPEMSGLDWANEHGWITPKEWLAAKEKAKINLALQEKQIQIIDSLGKLYPQEMYLFLERHIQRIHKVAERLERFDRVASQNKVDFAMRFNLTLFLTILSALRAWRDHTESDYSTTWLWRVAFTIVEESEKFILNAKTNNEHF